MSTSTKAIQFNTAPGGSAEITLAIATICSIEETTPLILIRETVAGPQFQVNVMVTGAIYYYIVLQVINYQQNGVAYNTDGGNISFLAVFDAAADTVLIGAQSTIANAYAFARMISTSDGSDILIAGEDRRLNIAYGMKNNFISTDGVVSGVISHSPNGLETNSYPLFNFLSSLLYYSLTDADVYSQFLTLTGSPYSSAFHALMHLVKQPFTNVQQIYGLISSNEQVFEPSLPSLALPAGKSPVPNQWTLTIKANDSGALNFMFGGAAYVVFDKDDKAWIANNVRQGTGFSGTHCVVLNADASPWAFSPVFGGGILGTGFGIAIDAAGENIAVGNYGWGPEEFNPQAGSVSVFSYNGTVLCPPNGFTKKLSRVQGLCYDNAGNLWMASVGSQKPMAPVPGNTFTYKSENSAIVVYIGGDPDNMVYFDNFYNKPSPDHNTFDVVMDSDGNAFVSNIANKDAGLPSSVYKFRLENNQLKYQAHWDSDLGDEEFRQVQVNAGNEVFVVGITSNRVIKLDNNLQSVLGTFQTNINAPWGITIDQRGAIYVANFGPQTGFAVSTSSLDIFGPFGVTVIRNEDDSTAQLMTLPTGGHEVMLPNGRPLYGTQPDGRQPSCYEPLMRLTSTGIDGAGNLWAMNNWKPAAVNDVKNNPGGDGVVIFVGVAEPA